MSDEFSRKECPSIPFKLWNYYDRLRTSTPSHKLVQACQRQGERKTWHGIDDLISHAAGTTELTPDNLLDCLGFDSNNLDQDSVQAMFGVLRTINMLRQLGFRRIRPLPPKQSERESDLLAEHNSNLYAVEVFRSNEDAYRFVDHQGIAQNPVSYIARRYSDKRSQLEATIKSYHCHRALLAVVMDSPPFKQLTTGDECQRVVQESFAEMGSPAGTYLLMFTGTPTPNGQDEYFVYPPL